MTNLFKNVMELGSTEDRGAFTARAKEQLYQKILIRLTQNNQENGSIISKYYDKMSKKHKKYLKKSTKPPQMLQSSTQQNSTFSSSQSQSSHILNTACTKDSNRSKIRGINIIKPKLSENKTLLAAYMNSTFVQPSTEEAKINLKCSQSDWVSELICNIQSTDSNRILQNPHTLEPSTGKHNEKSTTRRIKILSIKKAMADSKQSEDLTKMRNYAKLKSIDFGELECKKREVLPYLRQSAVQRNKKCLKSFIKVSNDRRLQSLRKLGAFEQIQENRDKLSCLMKVGLVFRRKQTH